MPAVPKQSIYLTIPTKLSHIIYYAHCTCQVIYLLLYVQLCRVQSIMPAVLKQSNLLNISDQLSLKTITVQYCRLSHIIYYAYWSCKVIYLLLYVQLCRVQSIMPAVPKQSIYLTIPTKLSHIIYYAHCTCQVIYLLLYVQLCRVQSIMPAVLKQSNLLNISDQLSLNT